MRGWPLVALLLAAGCFGGSSSPHPHHRAPPRATAVYAGHPGQCSRAQSYAPRVTPSAGTSGASVTLAGRFPQFGEDGGPGAPTTKLAVWWNLRPAKYFTAASRHPVPDRPGRVLQLGVVRVPVPNPCAYRVSFRIPDVSPSSYRVVLLGFGGGGFAAYAPVAIGVK
jgi:hypothetical protein